MGSFKRIAALVQWFKVFSVTLKVLFFESRPMLDLSKYSSPRRKKVELPLTLDIVLLNKGSRMSQQEKKYLSSKKNLPLKKNVDPCLKKHLNATSLWLKMLILEELRFACLRPYLNFEN